VFNSSDSGLARAYRRDAVAHKDWAAQPLRVTGVFGSSDSGLARAAASAAAIGSPFAGAATAERGGNARSLLVVV
jgi:hypothetical protein